MIPQKTIEELISKHSLLPYLSVNIQVLLLDPEIPKSPFSCKTPDKNKKACDENITLFETNIWPKKFMWPVTTYQKEEFPDRAKVPNC